MAIKELVIARSECDVAIYDYGLLTRRSHRHVITKPTFIKLYTIYLDNIIKTSYILIVHNLIIRRFLWQN